MVARDTTLTTVPIRAYKVVSSQDPPDLGTKGKSSLIVVLYVSVPLYCPYGHHFEQLLCIRTGHKLSRRQIPYKYIRLI